MRPGSVGGYVAWPWHDVTWPLRDLTPAPIPAYAAQVRQRLYSSSVGQWRRYARQLAPLLRPLRQLMLRYERQAGLGSSEQLLAEVLDGPPAGEGGSGGGGDGGGGGRTNDSEGGSEHARAGSAIKDEL